MTMQQYVHLFDAKEDKTNIHTKIRFYKPKDRLVNIDIAKNDGQSISVQKILKVL